MPPLLLLRSYKVAKVTAVGGLITRFCSYGNPCMECVARETGRNRHRRLFIFTAEAFGYVNRYSFVAVKQQQKYGVVRFSIPDACGILPAELYSSCCISVHRRIIYRRQVRSEERRVGKGCRSRWSAAETR